MRLLLLFVILIVVGCQASEPQADPMKPVTGSAVELEKTACYAAEEGGTCSTKLAMLGFITKEECCEKYQKCC